MSDQTPKTDDKTPQATPAGDENLSEKEKLKKAQKEAAKAAKLAKFQEKEKKLQEQKKAKEVTSGDNNNNKKVKAKPEKKEEEAPFVNTTPAGEKKDMSAPMRSGYEPAAVEAAWYAWWEKSGFFKANNQSNKEKFVMVIPPPNVTGSLHLGHALTNSVEDTITRWHRMMGREALWVPGTDHAGIATQVVVEKKLAREQGITRHQLGREKFVENVWKWKADYGGRIVNQLRRIGSSLDWDRECFTMDDKLSRAVREAFIRLFNDGLIYRDSRLVNWCCKLNTAISDIEVDHITLEKRTKMKVPGCGDKEYDFGILVEFAYKLEGSDEELVVATTRPETMLADTAVAVHPKDPRYTHLHGKFLIHPFHPDRKIPVICDDELVDMSFGTGAVKVTPAHDPNDYKCGKKNGLQFINMLNDDGTLNQNAGPFQGMHRFDARNGVIEALKQKGLFRDIKDNPMSIGVCSRSKDIIEPMLKPQWWVNCKPMAERAVKAVRDGELELIPSNHKDTWYRWLENIHDWCISRQLWWGHRCPAYLVCIDGQADPESHTSSHWVVGHSEEDALNNARKKFPNVDPAKIRLKQDPDVLDTWFSSGLFPFSVFGWPDDTQDMKAFYPTSLLETGHDILFFWVARMVMMGLHLTNKLPFKQVYLHAMVRDAHGRKMSKSLGNVLDPISIIEGISLESLQATLLEGNLDPREVEKAKAAQALDYPKGIPECGTDAMRFALCAYTAQGRDINLDINRVASYRNFCNKLWNVLKFAHTIFGPEFKPAASAPSTGVSTMEKWILSRLNTAIKQANEGFRVYDFAEATTACYNFWLYELCDVYLESMKPIIYADAKDADVAKKQASARETLYTCVDNGLRLLHPFMPFVSEELWQRLPRRATDTAPSIMVAPYPQVVASWHNEDADKGVKFVLDIIHSVRSLRSKFNLTKERPQLFINLHTEEMLSVTKELRDVIAFLAQTGPTETLLNQQPPEGCAVELVNENLEVYLTIKGLIDIAAEVRKLEEKNTKLQAEFEKLQKQTEGPNWAKVPEKVKIDNATRRDQITQELNVANTTIQSFKKFL